MEGESFQLPSPPYAFQILPEAQRPTLSWPLRSFRSQKLLWRDVLLLHLVSFMLHKHWATSLLGVFHFLV